MIQNMIVLSIYLSIYKAASFGKVPLWNREVSCLHRDREKLFKIFWLVPQTILNPKRKPFHICNGLLTSPITHPSITGNNPGLPCDSIRKTMRIAHVHVVYDSRRLFAFLVKESFLWLGLQLITSVGFCISCLELKSRRLVSRSEISLARNFIKYANGEINRRGWSGTWDVWNGMMAQATIMCTIHTRVAAWSALCRLFTSQSLDSFFEVIYCGEEISSIEAWTKRVRLVVKFSLRACPYSA
jgi:hypothetical protein